MLKLREARQKKGWSLMDVARETGITPSNLSYIERGLQVAWPDWRKRLCELFNVKEAVLFSEVEDDER
jgi:transcriptional regulator with XRE-family HTH domain